MKTYVLIYSVVRNGGAREHHAEAFTSLEAMTWKLAYLGRAKYEVDLHWSNEVQDGDRNNELLRSFERQVQTLNGQTPG